MYAVAEGNFCKRPAIFHDNGLPAVPRERITPTSPNVSDEALIKSIAGGDQGAMALLYARHSARVYRFALRMTGKTTSADDIVSEVFLDAWRQADRFKAKSQVSTWLLAIARNKVLSTFRRRSEEQLDDQMAAAVEDSADNPERVICKRDRSAVIQKCLSELSVVHREVIDLVYYHEKSISEVAEIVGVPASTVKTRMFYARQRMAQHLKVAGYDSL